MSATSRCAQIGPVSAVASTACSVTPVGVPSRMLCTCGYQPRLTGSSAGWKFTVPRPRGGDHLGRDQIRPVDGDDEVGCKRRERRHVLTVAQRGRLVHRARRTRRSRRRSRRPTCACAARADRGPRSRPRGRAGTRRRAVRAGRWRGGRRWRCRIMAERRSGSPCRGARPEGGERVGHVLERGLVEAGVAADPERALGDQVGRLQAAGDAMGHVGVGGLAQQVAAEELPRVDAALVQMGDQVAAGEARVRADRDRKPEPARLGAGRLLRAASGRRSGGRAPRAGRRGFAAAWPRTPPAGRAGRGRWRPACRSPSGCSPGASRRTCGRSRTAASRAGRRSAGRTCSRRRARTSSHGPSRGTTRRASSASAGWSAPRRPRRG